MSIFDDLFGEDKPKRRRLTKGARDKILKRQKDKCAICGDKFSARSVINWDHKKPFALGGSDTTRNIQALCPKCHAEKTRQDRDKIAKKNRRAKEEDPFSIDLFSKPRRGRKTKDQLDELLSIGPTKKRKKKKKDPFSLF